MEALDLTETQRDKVFQIVHSAEPSLHEKQKVIRKTQELLHQLTTADQFDATKARLIADEHAKALADLLYIHTETQAKVWGILTDMQRNLLNENSNHMITNRKYKSLRACRVNGLFILKKHRWAH